MPLGSIASYGGSPIGGVLAIGSLALYIGGVVAWINDVAHNPNNPFYELSPLKDMLP